MGTKRPKSLALAFRVDAGTRKYLEWLAGELGGDLSGAIRYCINRVRRPEGMVPVLPDVARKAGGA